MNASAIFVNSEQVSGIEIFKQQQQQPIEELKKNNKSMFLSLHSILKVMPFFVHVDRPNKLCD